MPSVVASGVFSESWGGWDVDHLVFVVPIRSAGAGYLVVQYVYVNC